MERGATECMRYISGDKSCENEICGFRILRFLSVVLCEKVSNRRHKLRIIVQNTRGENDTFLFARERLC